MLKRLSRVKTLTLLITTRNGTLRIDDDRSLGVHVLRSLSLPAAMELFLQIASRHDNAQVRGSAAFRGLLKDLDGHSLSIVLVARSVAFASSHCRTEPEVNLGKPNRAKILTRFAPAGRARRRLWFKTIGGGTRLPQASQVSKLPSSYQWRAQS